MDIMSFDKSKKEEMILTLYGLIDNWENEVIEFKEAGKDYDRDKIGRYFSALSNEANLRGLQHGWLVFGINNKERKIVGTGYRNSKGLDALKHEIGSGITGGMSFIDIYEVFPIVDGEEKRVVMFQIPAAITAIPTGWQNQEYARDGESLVPLSEEKRERIRRQVRLDWSKRFVANATVGHLDKEAIVVAREKYKEKMNDPHISNEVDKMSDEEFLARRKLVIDGKVTNAAMRDLLIDKFPDTLSPSQKERKVLTLLTALKRNGIITTDSDNKKISNWILVQSNKNELSSE